MGDAHYFHSSIYKFGDEARKDVISRFNATVENTAARCWYVTEHDLFELRCPFDIGPAADEMLARAIDDYIEYEFQAAERDGREPNVTRFPESGFDEVNAIARLDDGEGRTDEPPAPIYTPQVAQAQPRHRTLHLVDTQPALSSYVSFFKLHELPHGFLERALCSKTESRVFGSIHHERGLTCRAVRASGKKVVFNGRSGQLLPALSDDEEAAFLAMVDFSLLEGTSALPVPESVQHWKFAEGQEVGVSQWLEGMGNTVPDEPGQRPEVPKDAKRMLVEDRNPTLSRVRVPKGTFSLPVGGNDAEDERSAPPKSSAALTAGFQQLLRHTAAGDSESEGEEEEGTGSSSSKDSDDSAGDNKVDFNTLLRSRAGNKQPPEQAMNNTPRSITPISGPFASTAPQSTATARDQTEGTSSSNDSMAALHPTFPSYGGKFATTDNIGLTADATSQAVWELANRTANTKESKRKVRLAGPRPASTSASTSISRTGTPVSVVTGTPVQHVQTASVGAKASQAPTRNDADPAHGRGPVSSWHNRLVGKHQLGGKLVDDDTTTDPAPAMVSPGLATNSNLRRPLSRGPGPSAPFSPVQAPQGTPILDAILIDFDPRSPTTSPAAYKPRPGFDRPLLPTRTSESDGRNSQENNGDDSIVERVQAVDDKGSEKRYTMRQQAPKKKGGRGASKGKPKVELLKPDPPPPPRPRKPSVSKSKAKVNSAKTPTKRHSDKDATSNRESSDLTSDDTGKPTSMQPVTSAPFAAPAPADKLTQFVDVARAIEPNMRCEVRFGTILLTTRDQTLHGKAVVNSVNASSQLNTESDGLHASPAFNERLTTSVSDASYLLDLVDGPMGGESLYEFHIRAASGVVYKVTAMASNDEHGYCMEIVHIESKVRTTDRVYMHCPARVWDAVVFLETAFEDLDTAMIESLKSFLSSLRTSSDGMPAFVATVPTDDFSVERVLAKRRWIRMPPDGRRWVITETQDLFFDGISAPEANLEVTVASRVDMIAQQRLWFEAKLEGVGDVETLRLAIDDLVGEMDGVGYANRGPFEPRMVEEPVVLDAPFW